MLHYIYFIKLFNVLLGEEIGEAAQREVLEETGIKTEFLSLLSVRHLPSAVFGCSDLYFVVRLKPLSSEITKQDDEVEDCQWMDVSYGIFIIFLIFASTLLFTYSFLIPSFY